MKNAELEILYTNAWLQLVWNQTILLETTEGDFKQRFIATLEIRLGHQWKI